MESGKTLNANSSERYKLYFDGGSRGNGTANAIAGCGALIKNSKNETVWSKSKYMGNSTNNQAEYTGLQLGIEGAIELGIKHIDCFGDSNLVVQQMNKAWNVNNAQLRKINSTIQSMLSEFKECTFNHVLREYNKEADKLANEAMNGC